MASKSDVYRTHLERLHIVSYILCFNHLPLVYDYSIGERGCDTG